MVTNFVGNSYHPETLKDWGVFFVVATMIISSVFFVPLFVLYVGNMIGLDTAVSNFIGIIILIFIASSILNVVLE